MAKYKVGDKVRIVSERPDDRSFVNDMEKYLGKVLTVCRVSDEVDGTVQYYFSEAKPGDRFLQMLYAICDAPGYFFKEAWISGLASEKKAVNYPGSGYRVVLHFIGETTTATLMHGDRAVKYAEAKCSPADQFQYGEGAKIAVERLFEKKEKEPKKVKSSADIANGVKAGVREANREPKFGDKFVITGNSPLPLCHHFFDIGEVVTFVERRSDAPNCACYINAKGTRQTVMDDCVKPYEGK